jgi:hypothetical protein
MDLKRNRVVGCELDMTSGHGNELSGSIKGGEFLDLLTEY